jgi:hypothetical protein
LIKVEQALIVPDVHIPYHDHKFLKLVEKLITLIKPNYLVQLGDAIDCFQCSKFSKDPERKNTIYEDLMKFRNILDIWENLMPDKSQCHLCSGNHETRILKTAWNKAPELSCLLKPIEEIFGLHIRNKYGYKKWFYHPLNKWDSCKIGDVVFHHGAFYNTHTAGNNLNKYPGKFLQGHNHRILMANAGDNHWSATIGHGCLISKLDYLQAPVQWAQGFAVVTFVNGIGSLELIEVNNGSCVFRGDIIKI